MNKTLTTIYETLSGMLPAPYETMLSTDTDRIIISDPDTGTQVFISELSKLLYQVYATDSPYEGADKKMVIRFRDVDSALSIVYPYVLTLLDGQMRVKL